MNDIGRYIQKDAIIILNAFIQHEHYQVQMFGQVLPLSNYRVILTLMKTNNRVIICPKNIYTFFSEKLITKCTVHC